LPLAAPVVAHGVRRYSTADGEVKNALLVDDDFDDANDDESYKPVILIRN
jgi:hypothetical protein